MSGRILVVDDEPEMRRALRAGLEYREFDVHAVASGEEAVAEAAAWRPDVVLLDLGLPGMDGFATLQRLRETSRAVVIVISVMPGESDKVRALQLGADDYLVKPFGMEELAARIAAVLRRQADLASGEPVVDLGGLVVDLARRRVTVDGREVKLTPTEYEVLRFLVLNVDRPVTHGTLLRHVWGDYASGASYNTRYVAAQLRRKLGDDPARPRFLMTEPGVGYRLVRDRSGAGGPGPAGDEVKHRQPVDEPEPDSG
ncbi:MAG TPA: response regulator transcription factor [Candidatus Dormibacteraeota bacterium]